MITEGKLVTLHYKVMLEDGSEVDSSSEEEPLLYTQGQGELLPALEQALEGLNPGDSKSLTLTPENAYGPIEDEAYQTVEISIVPEDLRTAGAYIAVEDENGDTYKARVHKVTADEAIIDFNHPLAGQTLSFEVEVIDVQDGQTIN